MPSKQVDAAYLLIPRQWNWKEENCRPDCLVLLQVVRLSLLCWTNEVRGPGAVALHYVKKRLTSIHSGLIPPSFRSALRIAA